MENIKTAKTQNHILHMENRQKLDITGVLKVINFNEEQINLNTVMGNMTIKGKNIKINKINVDTGDMSIEGEISSIVYSSKTASGESILKKLFK